MAPQDWTGHLDDSLHPDDRSFFLHHSITMPRSRHEWLSQLLIYGAYRLGGYSGLMLWLCFFTLACL